MISIFTAVTVSYLICLTVLICRKGAGWGWFAFIGFLIIDGLSSRM